jgi:hypothetical protein
LRKKLRECEPVHPFLRSDEMMVRAGGSLVQEALMRRGINITVALILIALIIKMVGLPNHTVAGTDATTQNTMPIYGHAGYPNTENLPVQEAPQP